MSKKENAALAFKELLTVMDTLREKCPWDQKQTLDSLKLLTIEEVYELVEAISDKNVSEIKSELGDLLLHIVFYAKIASEKNDFDITDVIKSICEKLVYRHPHIYGNLEAKDEQQVKANWEKLKLKEGKNSVLDGVPKALPSIIKAYRIQEKVKGVGFEFLNNHAILDKIKEEIDEFNLEIDKTKREEEFGDILFSLVNYARFNGINPDAALEKTNKKFIERFKKVENLAKQNNYKIDELNLEQMIEYWNLAKT